MNESTNSQLLKDLKITREIFADYALHLSIVYYITMLTIIVLSSVSAVFASHVKENEEIFWLYIVSSTTSSILLTITHLLKLGRTMIAMEQLASLFGLYISHIRYGDLDTKTQQHLQNEIHTILKHTHFLWLKRPLLYVSEPNGEGLVPIVLSMTSEDRKKHVYRLAL